MDPYSWSWNAEAFVVLGLTAAYFLAIRGLHAPAWRIACFLGAMVMLLAVSVTPIHTLGMHYLLTMHLLQNVVLAEWAPLLVVLAIPPALAASIAGRGAVRTLTHPAVALPLWLANYMIWHLPWIYDAALESPSTLLHFEHAMYFVTGLAMWWCVVQDEPHRLGPGTRAAYVFAAFVLREPIGLVMALSPARSTTSTSRRTIVSGASIRSRISSSRGCSWPRSRPSCSSPCSPIGSFASLEEERRADVDHPPAHA